jgi:hypothetical protein
MTSHDPVPSAAHRPALTPRSSLPHRLGLLLGLAVIAALSLLPLRAPDPVDAGAPADAFSAERAFEHVTALATEPHPTGTAAHATVRRELMRRIGELGLTAQVQEVIGARRSGPSRIRAAWAQNVLTRVEGSAGGDDAVLLVAHYDSIPSGPGASDDAAGVAALLETLRALTTGEPPRHDVIALFSDAEELGLLGAQGFADRHPWADDVRLVLNFEARGTSGPSIMFETGPGTGALMGRFADAVPHPLGASYSYDVYRLLPNDTDFTVFKPKRWPGFNFAFIGGAGRYHTALDTPENLSRSSLQHHGEQALGLARHFAGSEDLASLPVGPPATYFALPGLGLVSYPGLVARALGLLLVLAAVAVLGVGLRRGRLTGGGVARGALWTLLAVVLGLVGGFAIHFVVARVAPVNLLPRPGLYLLGLGVFAAGLAAWLVLRGAGGLGRLGGVALFWALLTLVATLALPSTSYLMLWPLAGLVALLAVEVFATAPVRSWARVGVLLLAALPALWLWPPTLALIAEALRAMGPGPLAISLLSSLLVTLLAPQLAALAGVGAGRDATADAPASRGRRGLPVALVVLGLLVVVGAVFVGGGPTADNPYPTHVLYALDADSGEARWVTLERRISPWTRQFVGDSPATEDLGVLVPEQWPPVRAAEAPAVPMEPLRVVSQEIVGGSTGRRVLLDLRSPLGGQLATVRLRSEAPITGLRLGDHDLTDLGVAEMGAEGALSLSIAALPGDGLPLEISLGEPAELIVDTTDLAYGLPTVPGFTWEERPPERMPSTFAPTDYRVVGKRYVLPVEADAGAPDEATEGSPAATAEPSATPPA